MKPLEAPQPALRSTTLKGAPLGRLAALTAILLLASLLRFGGLQARPDAWMHSCPPKCADRALLNSPPGLEHDEVAHWLINRDILAGNHSIYFAEAYGHEALYHYIQAGFGGLVGDHALGLRLPSAYLGVLLVAVSYALGRQMFSHRIGLWAAAFLAVLFWPVFFSRLALRAISLPVLSGLAAWLWWRGMWPRRAGTGAGSRSLWLGTAGILAGLSLHTYMAGRAVPIIFAVYTVYLFLFHRRTFIRSRAAIIAFWITLVLVALPLVAFLVANPTAEIRIGEVDAPLRALFAGDLRPVLANTFKIAGMFGLEGDPLWRQNISGRPVFNPLTALLFYAGVGLSIWRWRDTRHAFLLCWLLGSAIPSIVTIDAPSSIRIINLLPVLTLFPVLFIHTFANLSTIREKFSTELVTGLVNGLLTIGLVVAAWTTLTGLWRVWPANDEVRFVWQAALTDAAGYLDSRSETAPVAIGGWTPETMDPPTMELSLKRDDLSIRYFDPSQSLILPAGAGYDSVRVIRPAILPFPPSLSDVIAPWEEDLGEFVVYNVPAAAHSPRPQHASDDIFGEQLRFLGYDQTGCFAEEPCEVVTYWQVIQPPGRPLRFFLHANSDGGEIVAQDDRLGAPTEHWQPGDIVVQLLSLPESAAALRLGVYDPEQESRLLTEDGQGFIVLMGE